MQTFVRQMSAAELTAVDGSPDPNLSGASPKSDPFGSFDSKLAVVNGCHFLEINCAPQAEMDIRALKAAGAWQLVEQHEGTNEET